jgi:hypothetical protein
MYLCNLDGENNSLADLYPEDLGRDKMTPYRLLTLAACKVRLYPII